MARWASFAIFITLMLLVTGGVHWYLWGRLVRDPALPSGWRRALTALVIVLWASIPVTMLLGRGFPGLAGSSLMLVLYAWLGVMFLLLMTTFAAELLRAGAAFSWARVEGAPPSDERRLVLARLLAGGVALIAGGLSVAAVRSGLAAVALKRVEAKLARLPRALDGTRIVQLTDVHIGPALRRDFLEQVVATTNAAEPDLVVITGDLVDGSVDELREHIAPLADLRARWGVYFVTGNHEYYSGAREWCEHLPTLGVRVLQNERVEIGTHEHTFDLAGVNDWSAGRFGDGPDLDKALSGRDPSRELVLLAHQPKAVNEAAAAGVGLQLSGHTHGGQIFPWTFFVRLQQPFVTGFARVKETLLYVSNGTGFWGPPMRLGAPAEVTLVTLRSA